MSGRANLIKGTIAVGEYEDTGEPKLTVQFDTTKKDTSITIEQHGDRWVYIDHGDVMALISALSRAHLDVSDTSKTEPDQ